MKYAFIFITVAVVVNAIAGNRGLVQAWRLHREHQALSAEIARLTRENQRLDQQNRRLREDPKAIEEEARRRLGLIRKGERVYVIKDVASPSTPAPSRPAASSSPAEREAR